MALTGRPDKMFTAWHKSRVCDSIIDLRVRANVDTGFTEGKPYKLTTSNGRQFTTDQYALVAHGSSERPWPFLACSDSKVTDAEFDRYLSTLEKDGLRAPSRKFINAKLDDIHALLNHNWTEADIQAKISKQSAMEKKYDPANAVNLQREKINKRRARAQEDDDADEVAKCDAELADLENHNASNGSRSQPRELPSKPKQKQMEHERLQKLNIETIAEAHVRSRGWTLQDLQPSSCTPSHSTNCHVSCLASCCHCSGLEYGRDGTRGCHGMHRSC